MKVNTNRKLMEGQCEGEREREEDRVRERD